jgi:hypothetical protein
MIAIIESNSLAAKLNGPISAILEKQRSTIADMVGGNSKEIIQTALHNDKIVRKIAEYCYFMLPGLVRIAVKEDVFVEFVMNNRQRIFSSMIEKGG